MKVQFLFAALVLSATLTYADGERIARASCEEYSSYGGMQKTFGKHDVVIHNLTPTTQVVHVEFKDCVDVHPCGIKVIDKVLKPNERWFSGIYQVPTRFHIRNPGLFIQRTSSTISGYINLNVENKCYVRILKD